MPSDLIRDLTAPYRRAGINMREHHMPAPERHRPVVETIVSNGFAGIVVKEPETGAFVHCERPVGVRR